MDIQKKLNEILGWPIPQSQTIGNMEDDTTLEPCWSYGFLIKREEKEYKQNIVMIGMFIIQKIKN